MGLLCQEEFLLKYNIDDKVFVKTLYTWEELSAIYDDYTNEILNMEDSATYIFQRLMKIDGIHSVRYRIKDPEHLIEKIIRKKIDKPDIEKISIQNYKENVTDLIGLRALHLFKEDWLPIHKVISSSWDFKEKPVANYRIGDPEEFISWFTDNGCEKKEHGFGYRSVHYIIETKPTKQKYYAEVQVRTIFEEAWSEIDHTIRYPYDRNNTVFGQFLLILNRLAGSADEMGTFIQTLKKSLIEKDSLHQKEIADKDQIIKDLESKIRSSNMEKADVDGMIKDLEHLKPMTYFSSFDFLKNLDAGIISKIHEKSKDYGWNKYLLQTNIAEKLGGLSNINNILTSKLYQKTEDKNEENKSFVLPSKGNKITETDIKNYQIRITADFKPFFPSKSSKVKVVIQNEHECTFIHRGERSHILRLGKNAAVELDLKAGVSVKFTVVGEHEYKLVKV